MAPLLKGGSVSVLYANRTAGTNMQSRNFESTAVSAALAGALFLHSKAQGLAAIESVRIQSRGVSTTRVMQR